MNNPFPPPPGHAPVPDCYWVTRSDAVRQINDALHEIRIRARAGVLCVTGLPAVGKTQLLKQWKAACHAADAVEREIVVQISFSDVFDEGAVLKPESIYSRQFVRQLWLELKAALFLEKENLDLEGSPTEILQSVSAAVQRHLQSGCVYVIIQNFSRFFQQKAKNLVEGTDFLDAVFSLLSDVYHAEPPPLYSVVYLVEDHYGLEDRLRDPCWSNNLRKQLTALVNSGGLLEWSVPAFSYSEASQLLRCADSPTDARVLWQDSFNMYRRIHDLTGGHVGLTSWLCWSIYAAQTDKPHLLYLPEPLDEPIWAYLLRPLKAYWGEYHSALFLSDEEIETLSAIVRAAKVRGTNCVRELDLRPTPTNLDRLFDKRVLESCVRSDRSSGFRLAIPLLGQILVKD